MNVSQKTFLCIIGLVSLGLFLFPPLQKYPWHSFLFSQETSYAGIDVANLITRVSVVLLIGGVGYILLKFAQAKTLDDVLIIGHFRKVYKGTSSLSLVFWIYTLLGIFLGHYILVYVLAPESMQLSYTHTYRQFEEWQKLYYERWGFGEIMTEQFKLFAVMYFVYAIFILRACYKTADLNDNKYFGIFVKISVVVLAFFVLLAFSIVWGWKSYSPSFEMGNAM